MEDLVDELCGHYAGKNSDPFTISPVIVQSQGMARWVSLQMAEKNGIAANLEFPFPRKFVADVLHSCGVSGGDETFQRETMQWRIYQLLPELAEISRPLKNYIDGKPLLQRYQLAGHIAALFDNYMTFRLDWLSAWEQGGMLNLGEHEIWQAELWRRMAGEDPFFFTRATQALKDNPELLKNAKLLGRLSVFGISNLPAVFLNFFNLLGQFCQVDFFYLSPCQEYWGDVKNRKRLSSDEVITADNPLLSSWGILGRDFFNQVLDLESAQEVDIDSSLPDDYSVLGALQNDILTLRAPGESVIRDILQDDSLTINSCHSAMREVEVLYDWLLDQLNSSNLQPRDILVMAPKIQEYVPYIQAVFGNPESERMKLPFAIADRSLEAESLIARALLEILTLPSGRCTATELFAILELEPVARKFGFSMDDLAKVRNWIQDSGIRWGKDADQRRELLEIDDFGQNTWQFGFDRLMAGYVFDEECLVNDNVLPLPVGGSDTLILGRFKSFVDTLFSAAEQMKNEMLPSEWSSLLLRVCDDFFMADYQNEGERRRVYQAVNRMSSRWESVFLNDKLPVDVVRSALADSFSEELGAVGFLQGGITFCRLLPMRSIPARIICVLGLNEGVFPRIDRFTGFDLMAQNWRVGDRSVRLDDRYLFLETLLSSREKLYLSYTGQNMADNETVPPSILVSELLEYLACSSDEKEQEKWITRHPLQAFSKSYFDKSSSRLFSYSHLNCLGAEALANEIEEFVFSKEDLDIVQERLEVSLHEFVDFFCSPSKAFLRNSLGMNLWLEKESELDNNEPFELGSLESYRLRHDLLDAVIGEEELAGVRAFEQAKGVIPFGERGRMILDETCHDVATFGEVVKELCRGEKASVEVRLDFEVDGTSVSLQGNLENIYGHEKQVFYRMASVKPKDKLRAWLWHQIVSEAGHGFTTYLVGTGAKGKVSTSRYVDAKSDFRELVKIFLAGQRRPLPLFLCSSDKMGQALIKMNAESTKDGVVLDQAVTTASSGWYGGSFSYDADVNDLSAVICFGRDFPGTSERFRKDFIELARNIFVAVNGELEEIKK